MSEEVFIEGMEQFDRYITGPLQVIDRTFFGDLNWLEITNPLHNRIIAILSPNDRVEFDGMLFGMDVLHLCETFATIVVENKSEYPKYEQLASKILFLSILFRTRFAFKDLNKPLTSNQRGHIQFLFHQCAELKKVDLPMYRKAMQYVKREIDKVDKIMYNPTSSFAIAEFEAIENELGQNIQRGGGGGGGGGGGVLPPPPPPMGGGGGGASPKKGKGAK
jgi:hypothetical protein